LFETVYSVDFWGAFLIVFRRLLIYQTSFTQQSWKKLSVAGQTVENFLGKLVNCVREIRAGTPFLSCFAALNSWA